MMEKLVRDKIPAIIANETAKVVVRMVKGDELVEFLKRKLAEECDEFVSSPSLEELGDVVEVVHALLDRYGWTWSELSKVRLKKQRERGAFRRGMVVTFP